MNRHEDTENRARIARVTCGWKKPALPLEVVRRYWRDVHSPAIARRAGIWDYRHYQYDPVRDDLFAPVSGIEYGCPADTQLMWTSDVRYADEAGLAAFSNSPDGDARALLLEDIELIVDRSTTYKSVGANARTWIDVTGVAMPQGPVPKPQYGLFFRQRGEQAAFRRSLESLAERWAAAAGVSRLRLSLFDVPDMEAERKAGYPVKTHPVEQQYQAWIDLIVDDQRHLGPLLGGDDDARLARHVHTLHSHPVRVVYTSVYAGRPTLVGLRGYPAWNAIEGLGASHQRQAALLEWMYGEVARGGAVQEDGPGEQST